MNKLTLLTAFAMMAMANPVSANFDEEAIAPVNRRPKHYPINANQIPIINQAFTRHPGNRKQRRAKKH